MTEVSISLQAVLQTINWNATVYWRNDKIRQLLTPLVAQINVSVRFHDIESKSVLTDCLLGMAEVITDDNLLKSLNIDILMNTRSEDPRLRAQALACSEAMWRSHGGKLLGEKKLKFIVPLFLLICMLRIRLGNCHFCCGSRRR